MDRLPDTQSDGDDTALIDHPSASSGDIRMPHAFRSAIAAVEDKHGDCGKLALEIMFQVCVLSCRSDQKFVEEWTMERSMRDTGATQPCSPPTTLSPPMHNAASLSLACHAFPCMARRRETKCKCLTMLSHSRTARALYIWQMDAKHYTK